MSDKRVKSGGFLVPRRREAPVPPPPEDEEAPADAPAPVEEEPKAEEEPPADAAPAEDAPADDEMPADAEPPDEEAPDDAPSPMAGEYLFCASSDREDRHGDIVMQDWTNLEEFARSGPILLNHNAWALPIGKATRAEVVNGRLYVGIAFDMEDNDAARIAGKVERGFLNTVSVGFRPTKVVERASLGAGEPYAAQRGYVLSGNELMELSLATIPANPDAAQVERSAGTLTLERLAPALAAAVAKAVRDALAPTASAKPAAPPAPVKTAPRPAAPTPRPAPKPAPGAIPLDKLFPSRSGD